MTTRRRLSRDIHKAKLARREDLETHLVDLVERALKDHDPTALPASVRVAARLTAVIASQIITQTQVVQRTLLTLEDDISEYGTEFVSQLLREGQKAKERRVERFTASPPVATANSDPVQLADDWAGPVAGPTTIERYYGIPRSTLYRWQKLNEAVALSTRTSRKPVFPLKQFVDGRPAGGIAELIQIFGDARKAWQWLVQPHDDFNGQPPLDALVDGELKRVIDSSRRYLSSALR